MTLDGKHLVFGGADGQVHWAEVRGLIIDLAEVAEQAIQNNDPSHFSNLLERMLPAIELIADEYQRGETLELLVSGAEEMVETLLEGHRVEDAVQIAKAVTIDEVREAFLTQILQDSCDSIDESPVDSDSIEALGATIVDIPSQLGFETPPDAARPQFRNCLASIAYSLAKRGNFDACERWVDHACDVMDGLGFNDDENAHRRNELDSTFASLIHGIGCKALLAGRGTLAEKAIRQGEAMLFGIDNFYFLCRLLSWMIEGNLEANRVDAAADLVKYWFRKIDETRMEQAISRDVDEILNFSVATVDLDTLENMVQLNHRRSQANEASPHAKDDTNYSIQQARIRVLTNTGQLQIALAELDQLRDAASTNDHLKESQLLDLYLQLSIKLGRDQQLDWAQKAISQASSLVLASGTYQLESSLNKLVVSYAELLSAAESSCDPLVAQWRISAETFLQQYLSIGQIDSHKLSVAAKLISVSYADRQFYLASVDHALSTLPSVTQQVRMISELVGYLADSGTTESMVELLERASQIMDSNPDLNFDDSGFIEAVAVVSKKTAADGHPAIALNRIAEHESFVTCKLDHNNRFEHPLPAAYASTWEVADAYAVIIAEFCKNNQMEAATNELAKFQDSILADFVRMSICEHLLLSSLNLFQNPRQRIFVVNQLEELADATEQIRTTMPDFFGLLCGTTYYLLSLATLVCTEADDHETARRLLQTASKFSTYDKTESNFYAELLFVAALAWTGESAQAEDRMAECQAALDMGLTASDPQLLGNLLFLVDLGPIVAKAGENDFEAARKIAFDLPNIPYIAGGLLTIAFAHAKQGEGTLAAQTVAESRSILADSTEIPDRMKRCLSEIKGLVVAALNAICDFANASQVESMEL